MYYQHVFMVKQWLFCEAIYFSIAAKGIEAEQRSRQRTYFLHFYCGISWQFDFRTINTALTKKYSLAIYSLSIIVQLT